MEMFLSQAVNNIYFYTGGYESDSLISLLHTGKKNVILFCITLNKPKNKNSRP